jgi:polyisoprenyl-teichoic acid--peptidoglycan teichoic acid transferase
MEKTPGYPQDDWRSRRTVTRATTTNNQNWDRTSARYRRQGVLAKRRRLDTRATLALIGVAVFILAGCFVLSAIAIGSVRGMIEKNSPPAEATQDPVEADIPAAGAVQASGKTNILLLGSDMRKGDSGFRTDVIMLVSINADQKKVSVVSFPRDLWVEVPSLYPMKINMVLGLGGYDALVDMFKTNFDVQPDAYILTNFEGFNKIISSLGGIDVQVEQTLTDDCDLPQQVDGDCTVDPGVVHMNGPTALWYVRSRHTTSDFDRMRRMQEVVYAMFSKMITAKEVSRLPEMYRLFAGSVQTNIKMKQVIPLLPIAAEISKDSSRIQRLAIDEEVATPGWASNGMWILVPNLDAIREKLRQAGIIE